MTDFQNLVVVASGIMTLVALATTVWNFVSSGSRANAKKIADHEREMASLKLRVQVLEGEIKSMPGVSDLHKLEMVLSEMRGDLKAMGATMRGMSESLSRTEDIVTRHEDHLRKNP